MARRYSCLSVTIASLVVYDMRRKGYYCEWLIDPRFVATHTALTRLMGHYVFIVYGRIKSIGKISIRDKQHIKIDIRPLLAGIPIQKMDRTPDIAYIRDFENNFSLR